MPRDVLAATSDGCVDLDFGSRAIAGREPNWIPTLTDGKFEALARYYGPQPTLFDQSWALPGIERLL